MSINLSNSIENNQMNIINNDNDIILKLGDIIFIKDPTNEILNNNTFYIDYIDKTKIVLIKESDLTETILRINNGVIGDGTISNIDIMYRNKEDGYARQNNLLPGEWINIEIMGDDIPSYINGEITNLENDMIEIKTMEGDVLYINFDYKGIPEDLDIKKIEITKKPESLKRQIEEYPEEPVAETEVIEEIREENPDLEEGEILEIEPELFVPSKLLPKSVLKKNIIEADQIFFGEYLGQVEELVNIDKENYRFDLEKQTNDLLNDMVSVIPSDKRSTSILNNIHTMITRFIQLREISSVFDKNHNVIDVIIKKSDDKPLADYLSKIKNNLYWLFFVAENNKKIYYPDNKFEEEEIGDITKINQIENMLEIDNIFKNYKTNLSSETQNKYNELYNSLNKYLTPFSNQNITDINRIIIEREINDNTYAIIDNLGNLNSSTYHNRNINNTRFFRQMYNTGLDKLYSANLKGSRLNAIRNKLTPNDVISIKSILTLPEPAVRFSKINLPGSNLLIKANLNQNFLNYWELLKKRTKVNNIEITDFETELKFTNDNFIENINHYKLQNIQDNPDIKQIHNIDRFKKFLDIIVPKIKTIFNLTKKYIVGKVSLVNVIGYLEPFLIYPDDLTFFQYKDINNFLYKKISAYNSNLVQKGRILSLLKSTSYADINKNIFDLLDSDSTIKKLNVEDYEYNPSKYIYLTDSEILRNMYLIDFTGLFTISMAFENIYLMYPDKLKDIFETDKEPIEIAKNEALNDNDNKCKNYILSKRYDTKDLLLQDNNKTIYFDKQYDTTDYSIINSYTKEQSILSPEEFYIFLTDKLKNKYKLSDYESEYLAETLIDGVKKVKEGDYAVIFSPKGNEYYVRKDDTWIFDSQSDTNFMMDDEGLCITQPDCLFTEMNDKLNKEMCNSLDLTRENMVLNALNTILNEFDKKYDITKESFEKKIIKFLNKKVSNIDYLKKIQRNYFYKYNNKFYNIGLEYEDNSKNIVVSPYSKLASLILGEPDFIKKQNYIILFKEKYTRMGNPKIPNINDGEMESIHWLYCKQTNVKLMPTFLSILANTFIKFPDKYETILNNLIKLNGQLSDDGDSIVDKHSGYVMKAIDFSTEEGYEEGFKIKSRDLLEKDASTEFLQNAKNTNIKLSPQSQIIMNIVNTLSNNMGINVDNEIDFILKIVNNSLNDNAILEKEPAYNKRLEERAKKGLKTPAYIDVYNSTLLYLTLGTFLIAVQTSVPSIRTRKTFPGCVRSFDGYPVYGEGNYGGITYVSCVAFKLKNPTYPWKTLKGIKNEEGIIEKLKIFINKFLLPNPDVDQKIKDKMEYLITNKEPDIPPELSILKWTTFLPPLKRFHVNHLENISSSFQGMLINDLKSGDSAQFKKILVIESKIIAYSFALQELIQNIVDKKDLLMKSAYMPFMDNACCNETKYSNLTALQYFVKEDNNIENYNLIVYKLSAILNDINILTKSGMFLSEVNTKVSYPPITNTFNEEIIFRSFIVFCKFNSFIPIPDDLLSLCKDKPNTPGYFNSTTITIREQISKLKSEGRNYNQEQFLRLFQIVSRNNMINIDTEYPTLSYVQKLRDFFKYLETTKNETISPILVENLNGLLDNYDLIATNNIKENEMRKIKNYLENTTSYMRNKLLDFIRTKAKVSTLNYKKIEIFLNELKVWDADIEKRNYENKISDDTMYNYINFFKNYIKLFSIVFPNMILNEQVIEINVPYYWNLSRNHEKDLEKAVSSYYKNIKEFFGDNTLKNILTKIQTITTSINILSQITPVFTSIDIKDIKVDFVFDKEICSLLFEYYLLQVFMEYIDLTDNPAMVTKLLASDTEQEDETNQLYSVDYLLEEQLKFSEGEQEQIEGTINKLKQHTAKLLVGYIKTMMESKNTINISFSNLNDQIFKLKEREKNTFTDRLKGLTEEERNVDNILKINKLGVWGKGLQKGLKTYDQETYDEENKVMNKISEIEKNLRKKGLLDEENFDLQVEEQMQEIETNNIIDEEEYGISRFNPDYFDGDYYGDETEDIDMYD